MEQLLGSQPKPSFVNFSCLILFFFLVVLFRVFLSPKVGSKAREMR